MVHRETFPSALAASRPQYRRESRRRLNIPASVACDEWNREARLYTENISHGGLFLRTVRPPSVGAAVTVTMPLAEGGVLTIEAEVAHVVAPEQQLITGKTPGFGIRFVRCSASQVTAIARLVETAEPMPEPVATTQPPSRDPSLADDLRAQLAEIKEQHYFAVLGVSTEARTAEIHGAFLQLARRWHPDRFGLESPEARGLATEIFIVVKKAYEVLRQPGKCAAYRARVERIAPPEATPGPIVDEAPSEEVVVRGAKTEPTSLKSDTARGDFHMKSGRLDLARDAFAGALLLDPDNVDVRRRHAWACALAAVQADDLPGAIDALTVAVGRDPNFTQGIALLRDVNEKLRKKGRQSALLGKLFGD